MVTKTRKWTFVIAGLLLIITIVGGYFVFRSGDVESVPGDIGPGYVLYSVGSRIDFTRDGNSYQYAKREMGWGGQEPAHRCIVGNNADIKLYIPDANGRDLRIKLDGFGVYAPGEQCQNITVYANDTVVEKWCMRRPGIYTATIPASVMPNGAVHIRFAVAKPYVSDVDTRALGAAVRRMSVHALNGQHTKKQLSRWIQKQLWGDRAKNPYNEESETPVKTDNKKSA